MSKMIKSRFVQSERPAIAELLSRNLSGVNDFRFFSSNQIHLNQENSV